jgi:hypothetical protein
MRLAIFLGMAAFAAASLSCSSSSNSSSNGDSVTQDVGPEGATVTVGGATVTFPAGALVLKRTVTISIADSAAPDGFVILSKRVKCEPTGIDFAHPITMQIPFTDDNSGKTPTIFWSSAFQAGFTDVGGTKNGDGTISANVEHFSEGFAGYKK